ncbi:MAG: nickel-dependent hydrogenase large subunit [Candidatus Kerfeldbacteria bacterium]|nr:nickel-dependent hydrogenase large subunit [Candidatus Kerfeldbacteria bacterium]
MHLLDLTLKKEITKVEGSATLDVKIAGGKVEHCRFGISEYKRFYTQGMRGKPYRALPTLLARICGTCSNAHLLASIEACEKALGFQLSEQAIKLKHLTMYGLNIRDHALHLYLFAMPDMFGKDSFLEFDENKPDEHQILHDAFEIKAAGNYLSIIIAGRSVHAIKPQIGGFAGIPKPEEIATAVQKLEAARPAVLRTIKIFAEAKDRFDRQTKFMAMVARPFSFLEGHIVSDQGDYIEEKDYRNHLEHTIIPYSHASGYKFKGQSFMVGALARINLAKETLHPATKKDAADALASFPSTNIFHNNLAQAIEILHCLDHSIELLQSTQFKAEPLAQPTLEKGTGIGVVEAPRGTLYHRVTIGTDGKVIKGDIVVPTGQNQINIEQDLARRIEELLPSDPDADTLQLEMEKLIRAYDPCMSCASHFLKVRIDGAAVRAGHKLQQRSDGTVSQK